MPEQYEVTYTARVEQLIAEKAAGKQRSRRGSPQPTEVVDLTDVLQRAWSRPAKGAGYPSSATEVKTCRRWHGRARQPGNGGVGPVEDAAS